MQNQEFLITNEFIKNGINLNEFLQALIDLEQDITDLENTIESQDKNNIFVRKLMQEHDKKADIYNQAIKKYKHLKYERYKETLVMIKKLEQLTKDDLKKMEIPLDLYNKVLDVLKENVELLKPKLRYRILYKFM